MKKSEVTERRHDYKFEQYNHGGSRIFIDGESGDRELLVDTYYDKDFAEYTNECTRQYFEIE